MDSANPPLQLRAFRLGPKNKRIEDEPGAGGPIGYEVLIGEHLALPQLMAVHDVVLAPGDDKITPANFPHEIGAPVMKHLELFDFSARADYGRRGVDEAFVRDKLNYFQYRPATLVELISFSSHLRLAYRNQWFEAKKLLALGSMLETTEVIKKGGWFRKPIMGQYQHYPAIDLVAGRPQDVLTLSRTEPNSDGNWPNETLFLAVALT